MIPVTVEPDVVPVGAEVLPGYRVEALLARGGRVDTYDVTEPRAGLPGGGQGGAPGPARRRSTCAPRSLTEGALLTTLAHPHLVRGYEVVTAPGPALVLETLPGATLAALVDDRRLGVADTALLGRQLVSVLGYLHRQGWVHLDVKPDNVVVQEGRAVLIDLGAGHPARPDRARHGHRRVRRARAGRRRHRRAGHRRVGAGRDAVRVRDRAARRAARPTCPGCRRRYGRCSPTACRPTRSARPALGRGARPARRRSWPRRLPPAWPARHAGTAATATMTTTTAITSASPRRTVPMIPQIRPTLACAAAAELTAAGVDLARPRGCPSPTRTARSARRPPARAIPRISTVIAWGWSGGRTRRAAVAVLVRRVAAVRRLAGAVAAAAASRRHPATARRQARRDRP